MAIWNERIREKRLQKGITLAQIADKLGVTEATAQRYESGSIKSVPYEHMCAYGEILGCSPAYLMGWEEIDSRLSGRGASDEIYKKLADNIEKHRGIIKEITDVCIKLSDENRKKTLQYTKGLLSIQQMDTDTELQLNAAHARTDIEVPEGVDTSDDDVFDDF